MRPVLIGAAPCDPAGTTIVFTQYDQAKPELATRIACYCVFCERKTTADLAVEHKQHKKAYPARKLDWTNFLLGCRNCNSTKGTKDTAIQRYLFPDECNTGYAFVYKETNEITAHPDLTADEQAAAERTLDMVGLNRREYLPYSRWLLRGEAWRKAKFYRAKVAAADTPDSWDNILAIVEESGFWSVWMTVFADHSEVRKRLIAGFKGTRDTCYDTDGNTISDLSL